LCVKQARVMHAISIAPTPPSSAFVFFVTFTLPRVVYRITLTPCFVRVRVSIRVRAMGK